MPFFYLLPNKVVQMDEGPVEFPEWPVGKTPGGWWGHHYVDATYNVWLTATRDDLGLPFVTSGYGRYSETSKDFERACVALNRDPVAVRNWQL